MSGSGGCHQELVQEQAGGTGRHFRVTFPQFFPIFPSFPIPQEQDIPSCHGAEMHKLSLGYSGDDPTTALNPSPAPQDPKKLKRVGIKLQWDFPAASCHQNPSSQGSFGKSPPKTPVPAPLSPKELCDPFRSHRERSQPSSCCCSLENPERGRRGCRRKESRQAEHAGEEDEPAAPSGHSHCRSCTYQPVEEVGHLHLGEVGRFDFGFLVRFGWWEGEKSTDKG